MNDTCGIVLDLATDASDETKNFLLTTIKEKFNGHDKHKVFILCKSPVDVLLPYNSQVIVSSNTIDLCFKAKSFMDEENITDFVLLTSFLMKKYWELVCYHMFSHIHNWSVKSIDVPNQPATIECPELTNVESSIKDYLETVGNPDEIKVLRSKTIPENKFNAGFSERYGGVSQINPLASLNLVYTIRKPDSILAIKENRRRFALAAEFDLDQLNIAKVEHSVSIWVVGKSPPARYDGIVTNIPGITIAAPGADCAMILLGDTKTGACGAVHSGWRGTTLGAVRTCLRTMVEEFGTNPKDVVAAIGPTVEGNCFEIPISDSTPIHDLDPLFVWPSKRKEGWVHIDIVKANVRMLELEGVQSSNIDTSHALCTVCNKQFYSHCRDGIPFGNQIGFISCRNSQ